MGKNVRYIRQNQIYNEWTKKVAIVMYEYPRLKCFYLTICKIYSQCCL